MASNNSYEESDFYCLDGKLEIGMDVDGEFYIVDVFGTPDENRIIDAQTGEIFSKDIIRDYLKTLPWKRELDIAKMAYPTDKSQWPAYPTLPDDLVELVSRRYAEVARRYAGVGI